MNNTSLGPNPFLKPLEVLAGNWRITGSHPYFPNVTLQGKVQCSWLDGGAYLRMHTKIDDPNFPETIAILGSDDEAKQMVLFTYDSRGISRHYNFSIDGKQWKWWRNTPKFSQRFTVNIEDDGNKMVSTGEMSREGGDWEPDLSLTYTKVDVV